MVNRMSNDESGLYSHAPRLPKVGELVVNSGVFASVRKKHGLPDLRGVVTAVDEEERGFSVMTQEGEDWWHEFEWNYIDTEDGEEAKD